MTYVEILNRDVPIIRDHARSWARQGVVAPIEIFYKHEAIAGQSIATTHDMTDDGWIPAGVTIPTNVPYDQYWTFLRDRLSRTPLFAPTPQ
jgi:hypothetical protein